MKHRALVADDERFIRELLGKILSEAGYTVVEATDCPGLVEGFKLTAPDIVIVDISICGGGGLRALESIRAHDPLAKVVMLGMVGQNPTLEEACRGGANHYIVKPFTDTAWIIETLVAVAQGEFHPGYRQRLLGRD